MLVDIGLHTLSSDRTKTSDAIMSHDFIIVFIIYEYTCTKHSFMKINAREFPCGVLYTRMQGVEFTL